MWECSCVGVRARVCVYCACDSAGVEWVIGLNEHINIKLWIGIKGYCICVQ